MAFWLATLSNWHQAEVVPPAWGCGSSELAFDAGPLRRRRHAERAGREPRLGTIVKLARALAYPSCEVLEGI
jgi:hypothetical protein